MEIAVPDTLPVVQPHVAAIVVAIFPSDSLSIHVATASQGWRERKAVCRVCRARGLKLRCIALKGHASLHKPLRFEYTYCSDFARRDGSCTSISATLRDQRGWAIRWVNISF